MIKKNMNVIPVCLELGDKGTKVTEAQMLLRRAGSTIQPTGIFTIGMVSAVKSFQRKHGLAVTGIINNATWDKLHEMNPIKQSKAVKKVAKKMTRGKKA